ncbi:hypothetical protein K490DRAFT_33228 [Saccharata proteae CBS 121410]|uniref:Zn(2)-C6 fungal-type domain-containing protein n=1 Tax=Saccharata proteae CBS 121410 TaxID=1314787 RepID=A0A9P4I284_9PEZI|nr:hypothetical protein K490DRAFT_33228 [Saccharata proteae CBS 121410]
MPRPKKDGAAEPKRRSRNGCWPCKARKVKCGEEKPQCLNCERQAEACDYSIRLNWSGRAKRDDIASSRSTTASPFSNTFASEDPLPGSLFFPSFEQMQSLQTSYGLAYPAPSTPGLDHAYVSNSLPSFGDVAGDPSSLHLPSFQDMSALVSSEHRSKRLRLSPMNESPVMSPPKRGNLGLANERRDATIPPLEPQSPYSFPATTSYSPFSNPPLTPGSSVASEEGSTRLASRTSFGLRHMPADHRRLSVNDLLVDSNDGSSGMLNRGHQPPPIYSGSGYSTYGYDIGQPDEDTPKNDDASAISLFSPPVSYCGLNTSGPEQSENSGRRQKSIAFEADGYYTKPVPIKIPKSFEPLPPKLLENRMNLLYFHHFLNHTARILVPHDCERNPFRNILPQLAVHDDDLLGLLLAYSASHRARLLCHREPSNRIAVWVQDVFPKLRHALDSAQQISKTNLTTAIMLASLEIISPNAFEVPVSWQDHLTVAREMIIASGGLTPHHRWKDDVSSFLSTWFAYLDVLGSLSGSKNDLPLSLTSWTQDASAEGSSVNDEIDCLLGFTPRYIAILARIAELAKQCEVQRIDEHGNAREDWRPDDAVVADAEAIRVALREGSRDVYKGCSHRNRGVGGNNAGHAEAERDDWETVEIYATNSAYHWAGLIHLLRRVLGRSSLDADVQAAAGEVLAQLDKIRKGSTAEACLLFPMFSAGCEVRETGQREVVLERLRSIERFGMTQVQRARRLMQRVWETGRAWETLVQGEFVG